MAGCERGHGIPQDVTLWDIVQWRLRIPQASRLWDTLLALLNFHARDSTASRTSAVAMDDACGWQRIARHQPQELLPSNVALPRTPRQPFAPDPPRPMDHRGQALIVAGDAEVSKVPLQHSAESTLLIGDWPGPHAAALLVDRLERTRHAIFGGTLPHRRRFTLPRQAPRMEKAEERKGRGPRRLRAHTLGRRPEVNQPGLVRVEFQPELRQPLAQHRLHPLGVVFACEQHDKVVAVADEGTAAAQARLHLLGKPLIEHIMQKDVSEHG